MRIVIDMQGLQTPFSAHRGVGRYVEYLTRELLRLDTRHEFYLALNGAFPEAVLRIRRLFKDLLPSDRIKVWEQTFDTAHMSASEGVAEAGEILRETFLNALQPDVIFCPNLQEGIWDPASSSVRKLNYPARYCSTLHDVVPLFIPEYLADAGMKHWYMAKLDHARASDVILTVSHSSKRDIVEKLKIDPHKIFVTGTCYNPEIFNTTPIDLAIAAQVRTKWNLPDDFILYHGGADRHKNLVRLLQAYAATKPAIRENVALVLIGREVAREEDLKRQAEALGILDRVFTPGFVEDADLLTLVKTAKAFVFPSTHEGFGLPPLEAMACGVPTIGSRSSSIGEVLGNPDVTFDPFDIADMAAKIEQVVLDPVFRTETVRRGLERAKAYSWRRSAEHVLEVFESLGPAPATDGLDDPVDRFIRDAADLTPLLNDEELARVAESVAASFPAPRKPRLFLDISVVVQQDDRSGIQRVTRAIAGELLKAPPQGFDVEAVYTSSNDLTFYAANRYMRDTFGAPVGRDDNPIEFQAGDVLIYVDWHPRAAIMHRDFNLHLRAKGVGVYHVVYDLIPVQRPETFSADLCEEFRQWMATVATSNGAICISRAIATELRDYLDAFGEPRLDPLQIGWFHLGADIANSAPTKGLPDDAPEILAKLGDRPTFLMVGTLEPRKGHRQALAAFEQLWAKDVDVNLVIVGRQGWLMDDFADKLKTHPEAGDRLTWIAGGSDEYLEAIYQASRCLIAASEAEGFGLPLIEAAQHAIPIIARDLPVFREIAGSHAFYFDDTRDPAAIAEAVTAWLTLEAQDRQPRSSNIAWLTWRQSAEQLVAVVANGRWLYQSTGKSTAPRPPARLLK